MNYVPEMIVWELTRKCNASCIHCGSDAGSARKNELSLEEAINLINELKNAGTSFIYLSGGEPTLRSDFYDIIKCIKTLGMDYGFITNGLNALNYGFLKEYLPESIGLSVDGTEKTHDSIRRAPNAYKRTWRTINDCLINELPVSVVTAVSNYNINDLEFLEIDLLKEGIKAWQLQMVIPEGRMDASQVISESQYYDLCKFISKERDFLKRMNATLEIVAADNLGYFGSLEDSLRKNKWKGCPAGKEVAGIESDGGVKACLSIMHPLAVVGNVREKSFIELWNNDGLFNFFRNYEGVTGKCSDCVKSDECMGGCCATSIHFNKDFKRNYPYCILRLENNNK